MMSREEIEERVAGFTYPESELVAIYETAKQLYEENAEARRLLNKWLIFPVSMQRDAEWLRFYNHRFPIADTQAWLELG